MALGLTPEQIVFKNTYPLLRISHHWTRVLVSEIALVQNGYAFSSKYFNHNNGMPLIRIRDICKSETENLYSGKYSDEFIVNHKDILIGMDGDFKASKWPGSKGLLNQRVCRILFGSELYEKEFFFICLQPYLNAINEETSSVTVKHLSSNTIKQIPLPLPPLPEQRAIVSKIEQLFSELDNGIENLKKAQEQLKVYRQAVLKKAFEGELTKEWRKKQKDLPTANELLELIKEEREQHYQKKVDEWKEAVKDWESGGKVGKKPGTPRKLDVSVIGQDSLETTVPDGWNSSCIADIISDLTDYHANGSYVILKENVELTDTVDYAVMIRATNFEKNDFSDNLKFINETAYNFLQKTKLYGGEILIGKIGNAGRVYLMPNLNRPASLAMNLFALRFQCCDSKYVYYQMKSENLKKQISGYVRGVGNPTIDKISIRSLNISLCSFKEQKQIVQEIESRLSVCDKIEQTISENLKKSEALRQSILKKAFEGKLLSEEELEVCKKEPDWKPSEKLLARIKKEKGNVDSRNKTKKRGVK